MARTRLYRLAAVVAVCAACLAAAGTAAAAPVHVKVRVEGPARTITQSIQVPISGTFVGHRLSGQTALGALLAAGRHRHFSVGLEWFDCCGFFLDSVAGIPGDARHFWAFKVGHTLSSVGAGAVKAKPGMRTLFYYTTFDPETGATEPTLGLDPARQTIAPGGSVRFTVSSWNDAGKGSPAGGAWVNVGGIATQADSTGHLAVRFTHTGTFPVRATLSGAIRSRTIWVHVTRSGSS